MNSAWLKFRDDPRSPTLVLFAAMAVAAITALYYGHGTTFSGDEAAWIASTPGIDLRTIFLPHGGHLIALSRLVYWPMLQIFGLDYFAYRVLALLSILLTVWLLFLYGSKRVGPWIALAPCSVLLFFGSDPIHLFQGNGFTVMMSLAFGIAALLLLDRDDRRGDVLACLALLAGILSYTVILPFVVGAIVAILLGKNRWRRIWVPLVPLAVYGLWRIWLLKANISTAGGGVDLSSLPLIPAWSFQSLSGVLNAITGFSYDFSGSRLGTPTGVAGPPLALLALGLLFFRARLRGLDRDLLVALSVVLTLFAIQVAGADSAGGLRIPGGDSRYMYPGAVVVILAGYEIARGWRFGQVTGVAVLLVALSGVATNVILMKDNSSTIRESGAKLKAGVGAMNLYLEEGGPGAVPHLSQDSYETSTVAPLIGMVTQDYGTFGYSPSELAARSPTDRAMADSILISAAQISVQPSSRPATAGCRTLSAGPDGGIELNSGPATLYLRSPQGGPVKVGRFGDSATVDAGVLTSGGWSSLTLPGDSASQPWKVLFAGPALKACPSG